MVGLMLTLPPFPFPLCLFQISPIKHLHLVKSKGNRKDDDETLQHLCDLVLQEAQCALVVADYSPLQKGVCK